MSAKFSLQPDEHLLRKDAVSLVEGRIVSRTGVCYLTDRRIVVISESMLAGAAAAVSILARTLLRKTKQLGTRQQEIPLKRVGRVSLSRYGVNKTVNIPLGDGSTLRMVMGPKQRQKWLAALDEALRAQGLERVQEGEETWRVRVRG